MKYITLDNGRTNKTISVRFRRFEPEDVESIIYCIREEYGDNYFKAANQLNVASLPSGCYTILVDQQGSIRATQLIVE